MTTEGDAMWRQVWADTLAVTQAGSVTQVGCGVSRSLALLRDVVQAAKRDVRIVGWEADDEACLAALAAGLEVYRGTVFDALSADGIESADVVSVIVPGGGPEQWRAEILGAVDMSRRWVMVVAPADAPVTQDMRDMGLRDVGMWQMRDGLFAFLADKH